MRKTCIILVFICCLPLLLHAWADWRNISNQHFRIYYKDGWDAEAEKALLTLEHYRPQLEKMTGNAKGRIPFTIEDIGALANGYTDPVGTRIALFAYPPTSDVLAVGEDWWQMVGCHEYLHMLQMTRASGTPELLRLLFGNIFYPHLWQPAWMTEGITVYGESQLSAYSGRLKGGTYPSIMTALAKEGKLASPTKANYNSLDTPLANHYTYGGAFYDYLTRTYGNGKLAELFGYTSGSTWSYASVLLPNTYLDKSFQAVFGKTVPELWSDWQKYEAGKSFAMPTHKLTSDGWTKSDLRLDGSQLYYIGGKGDKTGPSSVFYSNRICRLDLSGEAAQASRNPLDQDLKPEILVEQNSDFTAGIAVQKGKLYYTRTEWQHGFDNSEMDGLGAVVQLWQKDLSSGKAERLYTGQLRAFCPLQDGSILLSEDNGTHTSSSLLKLMPGTAEPSRLFQAEGLISALHEYGNKFVLGYKLPWRSHGIYLYDPSATRITQLVQTPFYTMPVSVQGDELIFNAIFDGLTEAYVMNLRTGSYSRITAFSDVRSPVLTQDGRVCFVSVNSDGYDIYRDSWTLTPYQLPAPASGGAAPDLSASRSASPLARGGHRTSYLHNIGHLLVPRVLHLPIITSNLDTLTVDNVESADYRLAMLLYGNDAVGDFPAWTAQVIYDTNRVLQFPDNLSYAFQLANYFFHPVKQVLSYEYEPDQTQKLAAQQYVNLVTRQNYGLRNLLAGFTFSFEKDFLPQPDFSASRRIWNPFVQMDLQWAGGSFMTRHFIPYEARPHVGSDEPRLGWQSLSQLHQKLPLSSEFKGMATVSKDPDAALDEVFGSLRSYGKKYVSNQGAVLQASIYKPVIKIREGLWSPQIYLDDISLGAFFDYAFSFDENDYNPEYSYGGELLLELGLAYSYGLNLGLRYGLNRDKEARLEFIMGTLF